MGRSQQVLAWTCNGPIAVPPLETSGCPSARARDREVNGWMWPIGCGSYPNACPRVAVVTFRMAQVAAMISIPSCLKRARSHPFILRTPRTPTAIRQAQILYWIVPVWRSTTPGLLSTAPRAAAALRNLRRRREPARRRAAPAERAAVGGAAAAPDSEPPPTTEVNIAKHRLLSSRSFISAVSIEFSFSGAIIRRKRVVGQVPLS